MDRSHLSPTSGLYVASEKVGLPTSHLSTTEGWNGPRCNPQLKGGPQSGRLNGSAALVGAPLPWMTSPRWTWFRALLAPLPQVLCSTNQLEGLFVSVSLVAEKSTSHHHPTRHFLMTYHLHPTIPLLLPSHRPLHLRHAIGSPTVPSADSAHCTDGDQPLPRRREVGSQSWLFCPLISLGLALAESQLGVLPYSTGSRDQVPFDQSLFWTTHANPIIQAFAAHFSSLDRDRPAAMMLQSWERGHLSSSAQEHVTPPHIASMLTVWLSEIVSSFEAPLAPLPQDSSVSPPAPSSSTSPSPFQRTAATNNQATPHDPICVSHPLCPDSFIPHPLLSRLMASAMLCLRLVLFVSPGSLRCPATISTPLLVA